MYYERASLHLGSNVSVLIVDKSSSDRTLMECGLEQAGLRVVAVSSADECMKAVEEKRFQAIVIDVLVPVKDGVSLISQLCKRGIDATIIALSSGSPTIRSTLLERAKFEGADIALCKPLGSDMIALTLPNLIREIARSTDRAETSQRRRIS
jgi:DNA-binding response OmpR family regulator